MKCETFALAACGVTLTTFWHPCQAGVQNVVHRRFLSFNQLCINILEMEPPITILGLCLTTAAQKSVPGDNKLGIQGPLWNRVPARLRMEDLLQYCP
jgi:hypothetical protein